MMPPRNPGHDVEDMAKFALAFVLPAAFALLPARTESPEARAMLLAIALQESRFKYRRQQPGPARGFWQFEAYGGVAGVLTHPRSSLWVALACRALHYPANVESCYRAIEDNDVLACVFARLLLWTLPDPLPGRDDVEVAYEQYLAAWRPGKPHLSTWDACYTQAWQLVAP